MDIGIDRNEWLQMPAATSPAGAWSQVPEWPMLLARMAAAWQTRREFALSAAGASPKIGSFACSAALTLASSGYASRAINQSASANRKPDEGNSVRLAGVTATGSRG